MTPTEAAVELGRIKGMFLFLPETPAIYPACEALVLEHAVSGKPSHDARLVAAMQVPGLTAVLTFDTTGRARFPGIEVIHPAEVTARPSERTEKTERTAGRPDANEVPPAGPLPRDPAISKPICSSR